MREPGLPSVIAAVATAVALTLGAPLVGIQRQVALGASNPIVLENQQLGTTAWKLPWAGYRLATDAGGQIKGYAAATSVNKGGSIALKVSVKPAQTYTIDIYRMGWYGGAGGRKLLHVGPRSGSTQASCPVDGVTGRVECRWATSYTLQVPTTWTSGIYLGVLSSSALYQNYVVFAVRDDSRLAQVLYQQPVANYEAYNDYPADGKHGKSFYPFNSYGAVTDGGTIAASHVSFDRPYTGAGAGDYMRWEVYLVHWLERSGYDVSYSTDVDTHQNGARLLNYRALLSAGHSEYWSKQMFDAAQGARDAGVSLGFLGSNAVFWQIRFEPSSTGGADRTIVCYKSETADPIGDPSLKTVNWRVLGRPEQTLIGIQYAHVVEGSSPYVVTGASHWVYRGTGFGEGSSVTGLVGGEADRSMSEYPLPDNISYTVIGRSPYTTSFGTSEDSDASIYQAPSRAWVFAVGTFQWVWGLDRLGYVDARIQRTTANALGAMLDRAGPTVAAPSAALGGGVLGNTTVPITVSWSGSDAVTVIDRYELQQSTDGGAWTDLPLPWPTTTSLSLQLAPAHLYRYRVTGRDLNANWSGWKTASSFALLAPQESDYAIAYGGSWTWKENASAFGAYLQTSTASGAYARITFTGRALAWVAPVGPSYGSAAIYVDGVYVITISLYSGTTVDRKIASIRVWSDSGTHTFEIRNLATAGHPAIAVDAFAIQP